MNEYMSYADRERNAEFAPHDNDPNHLGSLAYLETLLSDPTTEIHMGYLSRIVPTGSEVISWSFKITTPEKPTGEGVFYAWGAYLKEK